LLINNQDQDLTWFGLGNTTPKFEPPASWGILESGKHGWKSWRTKEELDKVVFVDIPLKGVSNMRVEAFAGDLWTTSLEGGPLKFNRVKCSMNDLPHDLKSNNGWLGWSLDLAAWEGDKSNAVIFPESIKKLLKLGKRALDEGVFEDANNDEVLQSLKKSKLTEDGFEGWDDLPPIPASGASSSAEGKLKEPIFGGP
jgi:hypothetical protein